jgi:outer membrane receptor protein involved in Fe transport
VQENTKRVFNVLSIAVAVLTHQSLLAQDARDDAEEQPVLEEILVTASKRGEVALQDVPISIQAFTGEDFERRGVVEFIDYARTVSGLSFQDQGPGDKKYVLRGMQSTGAATTGVYFDDMVMTGNNRQDGGGRQPDLRLVDMERIEILKGPQGTLYGASSMSGTIRMITNKPDPSGFTGAVNGSVGETKSASGQNYDFDGMINIPLAQDRLALRLVGYYGEEAGYIDDTLDYGIGGLGKIGANNVTVSGGRAALRWLINDDVTLDAMVIRQDTETDGAAWYQPLFGKFVQRNYQRLFWDEKLDAYNLALEWTTNHGTFSASGSYMERDIFFQFPAARILCTIFSGLTEPECFAPGPEPKALAANGFLRQPQDRSILSSEIRYASNWDGRIQIVTGVFFQEEENNFHSLVTFANTDGSPKPISDPQSIQVNRRVNGTIEQWAGFGELSLDVTNKLTATVGVRVFDFQVDEVGQNLVTRLRPVDAAPVETTSSEDDINLKLNLSYDVSDDVMIYANYAEGFRSGGNNEPDFTTGQIFPPYQSDTLDSYEIGLKGLFLDGTWQVDAAAYYMDWKDLQARTLASVETGTFLILGNVGAAEIKGLELGTALRPAQVPNFTLGGNLTLLEAELTENEPPSGNPFPGVEGNRIPEVPEVAGNLYLEYSFPVFSGNWEGIARVDYAYVGKSYTTFRQDDPRNREIGDYSLTNLRLTFEHGEKYRIGLFVDNVFDEDAAVTHFVDANRRRPDQVTPPQPRTAGISFGYKF